MREVASVAGVVAAMVVGSEGAKRAARRVEAGSVAAERALVAMGTGRRVAAAAGGAEAVTKVVDQGGPGSRGCAGVAAGEMGAAVMAAGATGAVFPEAVEASAAVATEMAAVVAMEMVAVVVAAAVSVEAGGEVAGRVMVTTAVVGRATAEEAEGWAEVWTAATEVACSGTARRCSG